MDTAGRSQKEDVGEGTESGTMPVSKLDPKALDRITKAAMKETGSPVESLSLYGANREWRVEMLRGEPDSFIANLNGKGLRLSGEPNPDPLGASPDSLMRAKNFQKVLDAIGKEGDRVLDITLWPERASVVVEKGGRAVNLNYGYDAELTSRDVAALNGAQTESIPLKSIDPKAIERMAKSKYVKGLKNAMYAILRPAGVFEDAPQWLLYLPEGNDPTVRDGEHQGARPVLARARVVTRAMESSKGEWAEVAEEGIAPTDDDDGTTGRTTGDDSPATAEGIDLSAGDDADATTDRERGPDAEGEDPTSETRRGAGPAGRRQALVDF